jgi:hypothetical protein
MRLPGAASWNLRENPSPPNPPLEGEGFKLRRTPLPRAWAWSHQFGTFSSFAAKESAERQASALPPLAGKHRQDCRCLQRMLPGGRATWMWRVQGGGSRKGASRRENITRCSRIYRCSPLKRVEEATDGGAEAFDVDQKGVVALWRVEWYELDRRAAGTQTVGDLLLLRQWEQDVGGHADH